MNVLALLVVVIPFVLLSSQSALAVTVVQIKVDTGNSSLDQKINNFYKCISDTGKDPPTLKVTDNCFTDNVSHDFISTFIPAFRFHHFDSQPHSEILSSFNHSHSHHDFHIGHGIVILHFPHLEVRH